MKKLLAALAGVVLLTMLAPMSPVSAEPALTELEDCPDGYFFRFVYNDSDAVGIDTGCTDEKEPTSAEVPGLIATELHLSCSDEFPNGVPEKSDLGDPNRLVEEYTIYKDGDLKCQDVVSGPNFGLPPTSPDDCDEDEIYYLFEYTDSDVVGVDTGCNDGNEVTRDDNPDLIAVELHVSCSDEFPNGVPEKSDLGDPNRLVEAFFISKDGGDKTCGTDEYPISAGGMLGGAIVAAGLAGAAVVLQRRRKTNVLAG